MYCTSCGRKLEERMVFCPGCGAPVGGGAQKSVPADSVPKTLSEMPTAFEEAAGQDKCPADSDIVGRKRRSYKVLLAGLTVVATAVCCVMVVLRLKKAERVYYFKDNGIWAAIPGKEEAEIVGSPVFANPDVAAYDMVEVKETVDGRYLLFPMNMDAWRESYDLVCVGPENKQPVRLGINIIRYQVIGSEGVYCLSRDGSLVYSDLKGGHRPIADGVADFFSSDDGQIVVCLKNDCLTVVESGGEEKQIDEFVSNVTVSNLNGMFRIYYEKQREHIDTWHYSDFVKEDFERELRTEDPVGEKDIYNNTEEIQRFWGVQTRNWTGLDYYEDLGVVVLRASYQITREKLNQTETKLQGQWDRVNLMVYDGETEERRIIAKDIVVASDNRNTSRIAKTDGPYVTAFRCLNKKNIPVHSIVEIDHMSWEEAQSLLDHDIATGVSLWVQWEESIVETDVSGNGYNGLFADISTKEAYILTGLDGEYEGVKAVIRQPCGQDGGEAEIMDMEVDSLAGMAGKQLYYLKDREQGGKELYRNGVKVASGVPGRIELKVENKVYYMTDYDAETGGGILYCYDGSETEKIASGVYHVWPANEKGILLLTDYSQYYDRGTLQYFDGKRLTPMEKKVGWVLKTSTTKPE